MTLILIKGNEWTFKYLGRVIMVEADTYSLAVSAVLAEVRS